MRISVFGLGYVGSVSAACLANAGHSVIGVDPQESKVDLINQGRSPIVEADIGELIKEVAGSGALRATHDAEDAITNSDVSLICVGTPSQPNGNLDLTFIRRVCSEIGAILAKKSEYHVVVIRSTMLPGTMSGTVIPALEEAAGPLSDQNFSVCINPEFLREGTAVYDYYNPPKKVIGASDDKSGALVGHALKVAFANEVGSICKALNIDSHDVMDVFLQDRKLNISTYYLKPGFAFGGSCLPKDLRALNYKAKTLDVDVPVLRSVLPSNRVQVDRAIDMVKAAGHKKVSILGLSFKPGTDDLRESPIVELTERLLGKGFEIQIFDRNVQLARLTGANRDYLLNHVPHISNLLIDDIDQAIEHGDTLVIGKLSDEFPSAAEKVVGKKPIIDLVRVFDRPPAAELYEGIAW
jgi:GDP-mannose 6-dehydrogenase